MNPALSLSHRTSSVASSLSPSCCPFNHLALYRQTNRHLTEARKVCSSSRRHRTTKWNWPPPAQLFIATKMHRQRTHASSRNTRPTTHKLANQPTPASQVCCENTRIDARSMLATTLFGLAAAHFDQHTSSTMLLQMLLLLLLARWSTSALLASAQASAINAHTVNSSSDAFSFTRPLLC